VMMLGLVPLSGGCAGLEHGYFETSGSVV
jgi:hypothetical protein